MQSAQLPQVTEFNYMGSTLQSDGDMTTEINKRNQCGWYNWRKMSGVLCDKRVPPHVKGKIHNTIVQPAMLYGMETVPVTSSHVKKLEVTEMKMCRWACGHTLRYHVRNNDIREKLEVENITERYRHRRTGEHPFGGQTEFCPNGENNLSVTRPRQGEKNNNELLQCLFLTVVDYTQ